MSSLLCRSVWLFAEPPCLHGFNLTPIMAVQSSIKLHIEYPYKKHHETPYPICVQENNTEKSHFQFAFRKTTHNSMAKCYRASPFWPASSSWEESSSLLKFDLVFVEGVLEFVFVDLKFIFKCPPFFPLTVALSLSEVGSYLFPFPFFPRTLPFSL